MITIFHGEQQLKSRDKLNQLLTTAKQNSVEIITFTSLPDLTDLIQVLASTSLLEEKKLVIFENILSAKQSAKTTASLAYINTHNNNPSVEIIFWDSKTLPKKTLQILPSAKIDHNPLSKTAFQILNLLYKNAPLPKLLDTLDQALQEDPPQLVFGLVANTIRKYQLIHSGQKLTGSTWQLNQLTQRARTFSQPEINRFVQQLIELDAMAKTSTNLLQLSTSLKLILIQRLPTST